MTTHNCNESNTELHSIQSLAAVIELAGLLRRRMADFAAELSVALDRLQKNHSTAEVMKTKSSSVRRQKYRKASSTLSQKEQQVWASVHVLGKTITQTAIEFSCTPQNISKHLNNAERKLKAQQSRSVNSRHRLPEDTRGQLTVF